MALYDLPAEEETPVAPRSVHEFTSRLVDVAIPIAES